MIDPHRYVLFLGVALVLLLTPGPAVLYVVGSSVEHGARGGVFAALGLVVGGAVHMVAALLGITALMAASPSALGALRLAGAAYLIYLGWRELRKPPTGDGSGTEEGRTRRHLFRNGVMVNVLNPKAALFFLAFLPQFVDPSRGGPRLQLLTLGLSFLAVAFVTDTSYALLGGRAGRLLRAPGARSARRWVSGAIYLGLGVAAALEGRSR